MKDYGLNNEYDCLKYMSGATGILKGLKTYSYLKIFC